MSLESVSDVSTLGLDRSIWVQLQGSHLQNCQRQSALPGMLHYIRVPRRAWASICRRDASAVQLQFGLCSLQHGPLPGIAAIPAHPAEPFSAIQRVQPELRAGMELYAKRGRREKGGGRLACHRGQFCVKGGDLDQQPVVPLSSDGCMATALEFLQLLANSSV